MSLLTQMSCFILILLCLFCVSAELKEAVRTWPHSDPVSWAQRTSAVALVKRLDQSFDKAVAALQQNDPKYYRGEKDFISCGVTSAVVRKVHKKIIYFLYY